VATPLHEKPFAMLDGFRLELALATAPFVSACASYGTPLEEPSVPLTAPTDLCLEPHDSFCRRPGSIEAWFRSEELAVIDSADTPGGTQGAKVLTLTAPSHRGAAVVFRAKWRAASTADIINEPRKELGAYGVQKMLLDPWEYVIPPTAGHCFSLETYRMVVSQSERATFGTVPCVYGILSYWLGGVESVAQAAAHGRVSESGLFDPGLFRADGAYRQAVATLNVVTFLIHHGDAHDHQFLVTQAPRAFWTYSVDNSIAFKSIKNPMTLFREDWSLMRVPEIPDSLAGRLAAVTREDVERLSVLEEYRIVDGQLRHVPSRAPVGDLDAGLRWSSTHLQTGLSRAEIEGVWGRIEELRSRLDTGRLGAFISASPHAVVRSPSSPVMR
jgi:hypothetical protein